MQPDVYAAVIEEAHKNGFRTAAHVVLLDDAKGLLHDGIDYIAHSVRDREVDQEFIESDEGARSFLLPNVDPRSFRLCLFRDSGFFE